jgi:hypothetical protein
MAMLSQGGRPQVIITTGPRPGPRADRRPDVFRRLVHHRANS